MRNYVLILDHGRLLVSLPDTIAPQEVAKVASFLNWSMRSLRDGKPFVPNRLQRLIAWAFRLPVYEIQGQHFQPEPHADAVPVEEIEDGTMRPDHAPAGWSVPMRARNRQTETFYRPRQTATGAARIVEKEQT